MFTPRLLGPYLIIDRVGDKYYSCRNVDNAVIKDYHVTQLRPYHYKEIFGDPRKIALRDRRGDNKIDEIVAHQGDIT